MFRTGVEESRYAWLEDYKEWLEDKEAYAEHQAFLKQALEHATTPCVAQR